MHGIVDYLSLAACSGVFVLIGSMLAASRSKIGAALGYRPVMRVAAAPLHAA